MSASDLAESASPSVVGILGKLGTDPKTGLNSLALKARVLRSGKWEQVDAQTLVPGDIVRLYLGDVVPGDCKLIRGDYVSIDQSALTGESLPVTKKSGDDAYSGSVVKEGEMV